MNPNPYQVVAEALTPRFAIAALASTAPVTASGASAMLQTDLKLSRVAAANPRTTQEATALLARSRNAHVRAAALTRLEDQAVLVEAAGAGKTTFAAAVARNPHTPPQVLAELAAGQVPQVVAAAVVNPSTPSAAVVAALRRHGSCGLWSPMRGNGAPNTSKSRFAAGRAVLAAHPEVLAEVARDGDAGFAKAALTVPNPVLGELRHALHGASAHMAAAGNLDIPAQRLTRRAAEHRAVVEEAARAVKPAPGREVTPAQALALVRAGSFVFDAHVAERLPSPSLIVLSALATRKDEVSLMVDGWVVGRLVDRFGAATLVATASGLSGTRLLAVAERSVLANALVSYLTMPTLLRTLVWGVEQAAVEVCGHMGQVAASLGDSEQAWSAFLAAAGAGSGADLRDVAAAVGVAVAA